MVSQCQWTVEFFVDNRGRSPVQEYIDAQPVEEQAKIQKHIRLLREVNTAITLPHAQDLLGIAASTASFTLFLTF